MLPPIRGASGTLRAGLSIVSMNWEDWRQKFRSNIPFALSTVAAAGIVLLSLLPRFSGNVAWVLRGLAIVLATFGPIATQVETRRADEAKRLDMSLAVRETCLTPFPDNDPFLEEWLTDEQAACLLTVNQYEQPRPEPSHSTGFDVSQLRGPTPGELDELERQEAQGEQLTPEQQQELSEARRSKSGFNKSMAEALQGLSSTINLFSRPEDRTPQQYRAEVVAYIDRARAAVSHRLTQEFVAARFGRIQAELTNGTDRPFESVIVELRLPLGVEVFTETVPKRERESIPPRPREFGKREMTNVGYMTPSLALSQLSFRPNWPTPPEPQVRIESSDSIKVTFPGVGLRPGATVPLPELFVVVRQDQGSTLEIRWEATAANANGRVGGTIVLNVGALPSPDGVLRRIFQERGSDIDC